MFDIPVLTNAERADWRLSVPSCVCVWFLLFVSGFFSTEPFVISSSWLGYLFSRIVNKSICSLVFQPDHLSYVPLVWTLSSSVLFLTRLTVYSPFSRLDNFFFRLFDFSTCSLVFVWSRPPVLSYSWLTIFSLVFFFSELSVLLSYLDRTICSSVSFLTEQFVIYPSNMHYLFSDWILWCFIFARRPLSYFRLDHPFSFLNRLTVLWSSTWLKLLFSRVHHDLTTCSSIFF